MKKGRGRPPLNETPMTPNTLKTRRRVAISEKREETKKAEKKSNAALKSWQVRLRDDQAEEDPAPLPDPTPANTEVVAEGVSTLPSARTVRRAYVNLLSATPPNVIDSTQSLH